MRPPIEIIEWVDSCNSSGWLSEKEAKDKHVAHCTSVGLLVSDTDEEVIIALSWCGDDDIQPWNHTIAIPKAAISKRSHPGKVR